MKWQKLITTIKPLTEDYKAWTFIASQKQIVNQPKLKTMDQKPREHAGMKPT